MGNSESSSGSNLALSSARSCCRHFEPLRSRWCSSPSSTLSVGKTTRPPPCNSDTLVLCDRLGWLLLFSMDCCDICTSGGGEGGRVMRTRLRGGFSGLIRVGGDGGGGEGRVWLCILWAMIDHWYNPGCRGVVVETAESTNIPRSNESVNEEEEAREWYRCRAPTEIRWLYWKSYIEFYEGFTITVHYLRINNNPLITSARQGNPSLVMGLVSMDLSCGLDIGIYRAIIRWFPYCNLGSGYIWNFNYLWNRYSFAWI